MATIADAVIDATCEEHLDRAVAAGHDAFRVPVEWATTEPTEGNFDEPVFERYAGVCRAGLARGLEPVVVLHHVALPVWLGADFWLRLEAPTRFGGWVGVVADRIGSHCRRLVTLVEPNAASWQAWITGALPPRRVGAVGDLVRALDHGLAAHVTAYTELRHRCPEALVTLEMAAMPVYELDGLLLDVLTARSEGIGRYDLRPWLTERRRTWYWNRRPPTAAAAVVRRLARSAIPLEQALPRAVAAVFDGDHERFIDPPGPGHPPAVEVLETPY